MGSGRCWFRESGQEPRLEPESRREKLHSGGRRPAIAHPEHSCHLGRPYRGALIPACSACQPHMKLWALCQRQRALSQKTLPVFVLISPICTSQPNVTTSDRSSTTWDTRHRLHALAGRLHTTTARHHLLHDITLPLRRSQQASKPQSLVPRPAVDHPSPRRQACFSRMRGPSSVTCKTRPWHKCQEQGTMGVTSPAWLAGS